MLSRIKNKFKRLITFDPGRSNFKFVTKDWLQLLDLKACAQVLETKRFTQNIRPIKLELDEKKRVLVIAPHPDDDTFGSGGSLSKLVSRGSEVQVLYVTDGTSELDKISSIRADAIQVCDKLGVKPIFMGCFPKQIPLDDHALSNQFISIFSDVDPDIIFITFLLDDHDDHRRVNELLLKLSSELELDDKEIWAYQVYSTVITNVVVDITSEVEMKREMIRMWKNVSGNRDWAHFVLGMNASNCRYISSREPKYGETFFVVPMTEYLDICRIYFSRNPENIYYSDQYRSGI